MINVNGYGIYLLPPSQKSTDRQSLVIIPLIPLNSGFRIRAGELGLRQNIDHTSFQHYSPRSLKLFFI